MANVTLTAVRNEAHMYLLSARNGSLLLRCDRFWSCTAHSEYTHVVCIWGSGIGAARTGPRTRPDRCRAIALALALAPTTETVTLIRVLLGSYYASYRA